MSLSRYCRLLSSWHGRRPNAGVGTTSTPRASARLGWPGLAHQGLLLGLCCALLPNGGCGASNAGALTYGDRAQAAYAAALDDFYDDDCLLAAPAFKEVRRQFPYSRFAALAELRDADCLMKESKYPEAISAYRQFIRYRPSHAELSYAHFQVALAHFEQIPSEWLLSPPAYERDQHFTQESLRLLRRFILDYPTDPLLARAQKMVEQAVKMLADHEFYVANFYSDQDRPKAAAGRLRTLLRSYPGSGLEASALLMLGDTYQQLEDGSRARATYQELVDRFPQSDEAGTARDRLASR